MGDLTINKIIGSLLAVALGLFGLHELSNAVFAGGGEHAGSHDEDKSLNEQFAERYAYYVEIAGSDSGGGEVEDVFDLGLILASADAARGERSFKGKCATCHSIEQGGANGTGPNLFGVVGADKAAHDGFTYSGVLGGMDGDWNYAALNDWLENPSAYARGTTMAFAGLRRDDERANVIAYLASYSPQAPAYPDPLPAGSEAEAAAAAEDAGDAVTAEIQPGTDPQLATGEVEVQEVTGGENGAVVLVPAETADAVREAAEDASEAPAEGIEDAVETPEQQ